MADLPEPPLGFDYSDGQKREEFFLTHTFDGKGVLKKLQARDERILRRKERRKAKEDSVDG